MKRHFPVGESGPLIVVVHQPEGHFDTKEGRTRIHELTGELYLEGVEAVRSITDPLGDFPPGAKVGLFSSRSWLKRVASPHARTQDLFVATTGSFAGEVTRLDVILKHDPFSPAAIDVLTRVEQKLRALREAPDSVWQAATFAFSGTTAGVRDLKLVTQSDNRRIQILVVLAVLAVLLVLLKRPLAVPVHGGLRAVQLLRDARCHGVVLCLGRRGRVPGPGLAHADLPVCAAGSSG